MFVFRSHDSDGDLFFEFQEELTVCVCVCVCVRVRCSLHQHRVVCLGCIMIVGEAPSTEKSPAALLGALGGLFLSLPPKSIRTDGHRALIVPQQGGATEPLHRLLLHRKIKSRWIQS